MIRVGKVVIDARKIDVFESGEELPLAVVGIGCINDRARFHRTQVDLLDSNFFVLLLRIFGGVYDTKAALADLADDFIAFVEQRTGEQLTRSCLRSGGSERSGCRG